MLCAHLKSVALSTQTLARIPSWRHLLRSCVRLQRADNSTQASLQSPKSGDTQSKGPEVEQQKRNSRHARPRLARRTSRSIDSAQPSEAPQNKRLIRKILDAGDGTSDGASIEAILARDANGTSIKKKLTRDPHGTSIEKKLVLDAHVEAPSRLRLKLELSGSPFSFPVIRKTAEENYGRDHLTKKAWTSGETSSSNEPGGFAFRGFKFKPIHRNTQPRRTPRSGDTVSSPLRTHTASDIDSRIEEPSKIFRGDSLRQSPAKSKIPSGVDFIRDTTPRKDSAMLNARLEGELGQGSRDNGSLAVGTKRTQNSYRSPEARRRRSMRSRARRRLRRVKLSPPEEILGTFGTVTTQNAVATAFTDLLQKIPPIPKASALGLDDATIVVLLLTPSYAHVLNDDNTTDLPLLLDQLFQAYERDQDTPGPKLLAAVVDRLTVPIRSGSGSSHSPLQRALKPPLNNDGLDGISYAVLHERHVRQDLNLYALDETNRSAALTFHLEELQSTRNPVSRRDVQIHLPLANTIFQNNREYTMKSYVSRNFDAQSLPQVHIDDQEITHRSIIWPFAISGAVEKSQASLSCPLLPLTESLKIEDAMGNIISRVQDRQNATIPASAQVEKGVDRFFIETETDPCAVSIWALLYPAPVESILSSMKTFSFYDSINSQGQKQTRMTKIGKASQGFCAELWRQDAWNNHIMHALSSGASLHRVMSGGGGWGKKAGLLSLDPYRTERPVSPQDSKPHTMTFEDLAGEGSAVSATFRPGDYLQFFIMPPWTQRGIREEMVTQAMGPSQSPEAEPAAAWSLDFGVIPSTIDKVPDYSMSASNTLGDAAVHLNHFSALSEKAIYIRSYQRLGDASDGTPKKDIAFSKVDVPYSRWSTAECPRSDVASIMQEEPRQHATVHIGTEPHVTLTAQAGKHIEVLDSDKPGTTTTSQRVQRSVVRRRLSTKSLRVRRIESRAPPSQTATDQHMRREIAMDQHSAPERKALPESRAGMVKYFVVRTGPGGRRFPRREGLTIRKYAADSPILRLVALPRHQAELKRPSLRKSRISWRFRKYATDPEFRKYVANPESRKHAASPFRYIRRGRGGDTITPGFDETESDGTPDKPLIRNTLSGRSSSSPVSETEAFNTSEPGVRRRWLRKGQGEGASGGDAAQWATRVNDQIFEHERRRRERLAEILRQRVGGISPIGTRPKRYSDEDAAAIVDQIDKLLQGM